MKKILFISLAILLNIHLIVSAQELKGNKTNLHVSQYGKSETKKISLGMKAPSFAGQDEKGNKVSNTDFIGKKNVLLVFYPGDDTPGCTKQLCSIRDDFKDLGRLDIKVFGINQGDAASHDKFIKKYKFPFSLIIDKDSKISKEYDAMGIFGFINRTVVLINKEGKVVLYERGFPDLSPKTVMKLINA